jgi:hypothetical protein
MSHAGANTSSAVLGKIDPQLTEPRRHKKIAAFQTDTN